MFTSGEQCCSAWPKIMFRKIKTEGIRDKIRSENSGAQAHDVKTMYYEIPEDEKRANRTSPQNLFMTTCFKGLWKNELKPKEDTVC